MGLRVGCFLLNGLLILMVASSLSASSEPPLGDVANDYDTSCFVPPTHQQPPDDQAKLFEFDVSLPPPLTIGLEFLTFPNGTCGLDVYILASQRYWLTEYQGIIDEKSKNFIDEFCVYNETNATWTLKVLAFGLNQPVVPLEELSRVPSWWIVDGIIVLAHTDHTTAGLYNLHCNIPYFQSVSQSVYNLNATYHINGCPFGKYGGSCEQHCSCATGVNCHSFNGACMCPLGLTGTSCNQSEPVLTVPQQHVYAPFGETTNLTCTAHGMLPSTWSWSKDGQTSSLPTTAQEQPVPYSPRPVDITGSLEVHNISANGGYWCEVSDEHGVSLLKHVNVTVIALPDPFLRVPQTHTALAGGNVTFACEARPGAGTIRWVRGRDRSPSPAAAIRDEAGRYGIRQSPGGASLLTIYGVEFADEGVYRCYVGHIFTGRDISFAEGLLADIWSEPELVCSFHDVIDVRSGSSVTLLCLVQRARPAPTLTWHFDDGALASEPKIATYTILAADRRSWNINTNMTLDPSPEDDGKRVSISVVSPALNASREVTARLNVSYIPIVTISPDPVSLTKGQDGEITCSARANPDAVNYRWTLQRPPGTKQQPAATAATPAGNETTYVIRNIGMEYDQANLTCRVGNAIGETEATVLIRVTDPIFSTFGKVVVCISGCLCLCVVVLAITFSAHRYRKKIILKLAQRANKNEDGKEFDVFISYRSGGPEEDFVIRDLIPRLEQDGYHVCVHYRSFLPGKSIIDNISDAVHQSRKTLLLLSPGFVQSEWCRYEFRAALSEMLHLQSDLIPVVFEDLGPQEDLSPDLRTLLRTLSYIVWPGAAPSGQQSTPEDITKFWKLLWQSLPATPLAREERTPPAGDDHLELEQTAVSAAVDLPAELHEENTVFAGDQYLLL